MQESLVFIILGVGRLREDQLIYRKFPNYSRVSINRRVPFYRRVLVYILVNKRLFQINVGSNLLIFSKNQGRRRDGMFFFSTFSFIVLTFCQSISQ